MHNHPVIAMEKAALARWCAGDPDGFLEISAEDVVYFDPFLPNPIRGLDHLKTYYDGLRGKIVVAGHQVIEPHVQEIGDAAVLTFRFDSWGEGLQMRWNCTEVYHRRAGVWKIVQTHWSFTQPDTA